jgi:phytoene dehydrogenase-like protein
MKRVAIVGAGVAGLSTGCYARMNGFESAIYEMHPLPGGVCTSWNRGVYTFDHCLHWVLGSNRGSSLYPIFQELGVAQEVRFHHTDRFRRIDARGRTLVVYTDLDRLEGELLRLFPEEESAIRRFLKLVRFYTRFRPPLDADFGSFRLADMLKMLPYLPSFNRLRKSTIEEFLGMFRSPDLREMLSQMFKVEGMPAIMAVMPLAYFHNREGGYPLGGSLRFARAIEKRFTELGGTVHYSRRVRRIVVEDGTAVALELDTGERVPADIVVSAADGRMTLYELLGGRYLTPELSALYENPHLWPPLISISLGVNRDLSGEVEINSFRLEKPIHIAGRAVEWMGFFHYCHDPSFAPPGKSVLELQIETDYDYWRRLYRQPAEYRAEKRRVLDACLRQLEARLAGISSQVEVSDVATPVTWERYTGNWRGSYQGWLPSVQLFGKFLPRQLPGLQGFYMTGQWTSPGGGVPMCMSQARRLLKHICAREQRPFKTTHPGHPAG